VDIEELPVSVSPKRIVITVHGIRTFGQWQNRLQALIANVGQLTVRMRHASSRFSS
jgi:hypothetical protein